jgi:curli biogenesis system outer membrane secretion channel CsgG
MLLALLAGGMGLAVTPAPMPAAAQSSPPADAPTIAVLDLENGGSIGPDAQDLSDLGKGLGTMLTTEMMKNPRVRMVERDQLRALLEEQKLTLSGMADPSTAVMVGKLAGAQYMIFGSFADVFSRLRIDVRVVEVETGTLRRAQEVTDDRENLFASVGRIATLLFEDLNLEPHTPTPPSPQVPARAALIFSQGIGFEDRGDTAKAREMYERAIEIFPDYPDARERLEALGGA